MELWPAIDLRGGRCVRLLRGDFGEETVFGDPLEVAHEFLAAGARRVHVVDLDAARTGEPANGLAVAAIASTGLRVQAGGGVRSLRRAAELFDDGIDRVVVGTAAIETPSLLATLSSRWPTRVVAGLDHRGGELAVRGWTEGSKRQLADLLPQLEDLALGGLVVTEIGRDGTGTGPDLEGLAAVLAATSQPVLASGGVGTIEDLRALAALSADGRSLEGAVVGRAVLSGGIDLGEAIRAVEGGG